MFTTGFRTAKRWEQPKCPLTDEWMNKIGSIPAMEHESALKRRDSDTCYNVDEPGEHGAQ